MADNFDAIERLAVMYEAPKAVRPQENKKLLRTRNIKESGCSGEHSSGCSAYLYCKGVEEL
jgi:hypothetical protein